MTVLAALWLLCVAYVLWLCFTAPMGYEDDSGFHYGDDPR